MYTAFASVYDRLMADVDYKNWAGFYQTLLKQRGIEHGKVCECACGTGSITMELSRMGYQMTGVDLSPDMLFEASQKARKCGAMIPFVKQDMRLLHLHRQMDAVLATNDGINYLADKNEIKEFFAAAYASLRPGGCLCFDLSTPYKLENVLGNNFIGDETESIAYLWQNRLNRIHGYVELNLAIFVRQQDETYLRIGESQKQYIHEQNTIVTALQETGFEDVQVFGDKKLALPTRIETRWFFSARKPVEQEDQSQL